MSLLRSAQYSLDMGSSKSPLINGSHDDSNPGGISPLGTISMIINYVMGAGFLAVPYACQQAGVFLSLIVTVTLAGLLFLTGVWELETMARVEAITTECLAPRDGTKPRISLRNGKKYELPQMAGILYGYWGETTYLFFITLYTVGGLWSYANVFAAALTSNVPVIGETCNIFEDSSSECYWRYFIWLVVFTAIVLVLCLRELEETVCMQICFTIARLMLASCMLITVWFAWDDPEGAFDEKGNDDPTLFNISGIRYAAPTTLYALIFHFGVPSLCHGCRERSRLRSIIGSALLLMTSFYAMLALSLSLYFDEIDPSANIMWRHYSFKPVGFLVVLFPAFDCVSVYPISSTVLGSCLSGFMGADESRYWVRVRYRMLASIPPVVFAAIIPNVGTALDVTGLIAVGVACLAPALFAHRSKQMCRELFDGYSRTVYTFDGPLAFFSSTTMYFTMMGFSFVLAVFIVTEWALYGL